MFTPGVPLAEGDAYALTAFAEMILKANHVTDFSFGWMAEQFGGHPHAFVIEYRGVELWIPVPAVSRIARYIAMCCCFELGHGFALINKRPGCQPNKKRGPIRKRAPVLRLFLYNKIKCVPLENKNGGPMGFQIDVAIDEEEVTQKVEQRLQNMGEDLKKAIDTKLAEQYTPTKKVQKRDKPSPNKNRVPPLSFLGATIGKNLRCRRSRRPRRRRPSSS
ncbi:uncharacterized protein LOC62_06G007859 [Vanrija pseudolonga]|uniref:Uncharacterized protein n=1 Tax=Vanrija pseudolonga TaxID=143232 RepID=A0AAF0YI19_9TREE|nr:hypothetical protein LOC62_06G007859 [Vanrija pseudolonga]